MVLSLTSPQANTARFAKSATQHWTLPCGSQHPFSFQHDLLSMSLHVSGDQLQVEEASDAMQHDTACAGERS